MCRAYCNRGDIYMIRCVETHRCYIGQAVHWRKRGDSFVRKGWIVRVREHFSNALGTSSKNKDHPKFYNAIRKYGMDSFVTTRLCICDISDLNHWETWWIRIFDSVNNGYNITHGGQDRRPYDVEKLSNAISLLWTNSEYREKQVDVHTKQWQTESYRTNFFNAIQTRTRKNGLPYNVYMTKNRQGDHSGYEVCIKRNKRSYNKKFTSSQIPMEEKLSMAIKWRDDTLELIK